MEKYFHQLSEAEQLQAAEQILLLDNSDIPEIANYSKEELVEYINKGHFPIHVIYKINMVNGDINVSER